MDVYQPLIWTAPVLLEGMPEQEESTRQLDEGNQALVKLLYAMLIYVPREPGCVTELFEASRVELIHSQPPCSKEVPRIFPWRIMA